MIANEQWKLQMLLGSLLFCSISSNLQWSFIAACLMTFKTWLERILLWRVWLLKGEIKLCCWGSQLLTTAIRQSEISTHRNRVGGAPNHFTPLYPVHHSAPFLLLKYKCKSEPSLKANQINRLPVGEAKRLLSKKAQLDLYMALQRNTDGSPCTCTKPHWFLQVRGSLHSAKCWVGS